ncbi:MAG: TRAP transporter small permease [Boseongicola sp.]|nr:TRAP transporter small permease [Boseongicola sp.]
MVPFFRAYDRLIMTLALLASVMIGAVFVLIVVDVGMRTAGLRPPVFSSAVSEYSLIYVTMLAAPWLVRERGHVRIDSFLGFLPEAVRRQVERILILVCIALCLLAAWLAGEFAIEFWRKGTIDVRSIEIPRALLFVPLALGFFLCAVEFARMLAIGETLTAPGDDGHAPFEREI